MTATIHVPRRFYSSRVVHIDDWYEKILKTKEFYDQFSNEKPRRYFYNIDLQGRLFLEESYPKNIATSIKDERFLNFFFAQIRWANGKELEFLKQNNVSDDYPFVSKCGSETNFIRPAATPIVFHSLMNNKLLYGGNLGVPFESRRLAVSKNSGKFYYRIPETSEQRGQIEYGLICASVGITLSNKITVDESHDERFLYEDVQQIDWLPSNSEPGKWALPDSSQ